MKVNSILLGIIVLIVVFGGIAASAALGYWNTESSGGGGYGNSGNQESQPAGEGLVRGRTTFQELLDMGITREEIEAVIGVPMPAPSLRIKSWCDENGQEFETIKELLLLKVEQ